jgi:hypothetical protein
MFCQAQHMFENEPVTAQIEIVLRQNLDGLIDQGVIQDDGAEHATLSL